MRRRLKRLSSRGSRSKCEEHLRKKELTAVSCITRWVLSQRAERKKSPCPKTSTRSAYERSGHSRGSGATTPPQPEGECFKTDQSLSDPRSALATVFRRRFRVSVPSSSLSHEAAGKGQRVAPLGGDGCRWQEKSPSILCARLLMTKITRTYERDTTRRVTHTV